jgi:outer membrane receptor protein involved in Fe transport
VIERDGRARLDDESVPAELRGAIEAALAASSFQPAKSAGAPVPARVRVRLSIVAVLAPGPDAPAAPPSASVPLASQPLAASGSSPPGAAAQPTPDSGQTATFGARGRVERPASPTVQHLESQEMRDLPGAFGDPFRVLDTLPGVVPALSGLPYVYVRGAPPAGTVYYYDGIQVPQLFHLALGPAVVHPALISGVDFYPSVAPARYGRYTGGVLAGGARPSTPPAAIGGELELRIIDVNGMLEAPVGGGSLRIAGRYGYPGPILGLLSPDVDLAYWDYQTQLSLPLSAHDRFELTWFGSFDRAGSNNSRISINTISLEFHRAELRLIHESGRWELGSAFQLGWDRSAFEGGLDVSSTRIGPRLYAAWRGDRGLRLRLGADLIGSVGRIKAPDNQEMSNVEIVVPPYAADVAGRSVGGVYAELSWPVVPDLTLDLGLRSDLWLTGSSTQAAVDPRASVTWRSSPKLAWHAAVGLGHQPAVFLIPLPGIADVGLSHGLQTALQTEAGVKIELPLEVQLETNLYFQYLTKNLFPDLVLDEADSCDSLPPQIEEVTERCRNRYPRARAVAYGLEIFLHRAMTERLSGWLSYTLGWANAHADEGYDFTPSFDVRHFANLVLQYRLGAGFDVGARVNVRSGKMANETFLRDRPIRYEQRLPAFFRADVTASYSWTTSWAKLRLALEWWNLTLSREATNIQCVDGVQTAQNPLNATPCKVTYAPAIFLPNLGLRADF